MRATSLADKLTAPPEGLEWNDGGQQVPARPGRPARLRVENVGMPTPGLQALASPRKRAQLMHTFWHHELQAAELMCWALLSFPRTPRSFRRGLLAICGDEIRHMQMYREDIERLGFAVGDFPVRDWFWQRVPACDTPLSYVATMGVGFEGGNLDHTARFAHRFRRAGDETGAALQEQIGREEVPHVRFALSWFRRWKYGVRFDGWRAELPPPLSPLLMRGKPLARQPRKASGMPDSFVEALAGWRADDPRR